MAMSGTIYSHRELVVWQKAMDLVVLIYSITEKLPKTEIYGLTAQMRRSAVSIPSNIAEGRKRGGAKEYRNFLYVANASGAELETQIEICKRLTLTKHLDFTQAEQILSEVGKMLNATIGTLSRQIKENS